MRSLLKTTCAALILSGGILVTAPGAFADWFHHHHHRHHRHHRLYSYHRPYYNQGWATQRPYYSQRRYSSRLYGPYSEYRTRQWRHDD